MKLLVPGHKYLGPGNKLKKPYIPVDDADKVALEHDINYSNALSYSDIRLADKKAIYKFGSNFLKDYSWCNAVGFLGLGTKYALESITGVLYPQMPNFEKVKNIFKKEKSSWTRQDWIAVKKFNKDKRILMTRKRIGDEQPSTSGKQARKDLKEDSHRDEDFQSTQEGEEQVFGQTSGEPSGSAQMEFDEEGVDTPDAPILTGEGRTTAGSAVPTGPGGNAPMYKCLQDHSHVRTFYKEHNLLLWGNKWFSGNEKITTETVGKHICTSLAEFPVNYLGFYMNESDFDSLSPNCDTYVEHMEVNLIPMGETTSFLTGTTLSASASAYHFLHGAFAVGLNHTFPCQGVKITLKEGSMEVDSSAVYTPSDIKERLYGVSDNTKTDWLEDYPTSLKHFRDWNYRLSILHPGKDLAGNKFTASDSGTFDLTSHVHDFNWMEVKDKVFTYTYKPNFAPIINGRHFNFGGFKDRKYVYGSLIPGGYPGLTIKKANNGTLGFSMGTTFPTIVGQTNFSKLDQIIEKGAFVGHLTSNRQKIGVPPSLHFGLYPTRSNTPSSEFETVNSAIYVKVATKIICKVVTGQRMTTNTYWRPSKYSLFGKDQPILGDVSNVHEFGATCVSMGKPWNT